MKYLEADSGRIRSAERRLELDVWLEWLGELLNLDSANEEKAWITNSETQLLITGMDCLRKCGHKDFEVVEPGRNPHFVIIVTERDRISIWAWTRFHAFVYYPEVKN